jgi:hypothetical protein
VTSPPAATGALQGEGRGVHRGARQHPAAWGRQPVRPGAWPLRLAPPHLMRVALRFLCLPSLNTKDSADAEIADCPGPAGAIKRC